MANRSGRRIGRWNTAEVRDDMIRRYVDGQQPLRRIAAELGCSYGTVHLVLCAAGVVLRPRGGSSRRTDSAPASTALPLEPTTVTSAGAR